MNNKQIERVIALYLLAAKSFALLLLVVLIFLAGLATAEASPASPKDGLCEYMVIEDGTITHTEVVKC